MPVSRIQISGAGENTFVKLKGTFLSDRLDQIRSVSVKGSHSQGADNWSMREGRLGSMFFPLSAGKVTLLHETGFLHIKGINFRIRNCTREGIRKKFKILEKNSIEALVIIIWRRKELSNLDNLKGFSMYLGGNCRWVPLSTIA